jgi:hypothetical protein
MFSNICSNKWPSLFHALMKVLTRSFLPYVVPTRCLRNLASSIAMVASLAPSAIPDDVQKDLACHITHLVISETKCGLGRGGGGGGGSSSVDAREVDPRIVREYGDRAWGELNTRGMQEIMEDLLALYKVVCYQSPRIGNLARALLCVMAVLDETAQSDKTMPTPVAVRNEVADNLSRLADGYPVSIFDMSFGAEDAAKKRPRDAEKDHAEEVIEVLDSEDEDEVGRESPMPELSRHKPRIESQDGEVGEMGRESPLSKTPESPLIRRKHRRPRPHCESREARDRRLCAKAAKAAHRKWVDAWVQKADKELDLFLAWNSGDKLKQAQADSSFRGLLHEYILPAQREENEWGEVYFDAAVARRGLSRRNGKEGVRPRFEKVAAMKRGGAHSQNRER